jgi:hypothetical protein
MQCSQCKSFNTLHYHTKPEGYITLYPYVTKEMQYWRCNDCLNIWEVEILKRTNDETGN